MYLFYPHNSSFRPLKYGEHCPYQGTLFREVTKSKLLEAMPSSKHEELLGGRGATECESSNSVLSNSANAREKGHSVEISTLVIQKGNKTEKIVLHRRLGKL